MVALAQSVKASREVLRQEAGFAEADTVARFLKDQSMQESARGGVILVDEASQVGTRDMGKVFDVAEKINARVILVGDRRQHRSVAAGEPLKLLEEKAGLRVAEVAEILRQQGDYKKAAQALSEGRTKEGFEELDKLGWIRQVEGKDRDRQLAGAYLATVAETKRGGKAKSALVVSPTHAEGDRITQAIRAGLKAEGKLGKERLADVWVPAHLTDAQKADPTQYDPGFMLQSFQNAPGYDKGERLIVGEGSKLPTELANRFEAYQPAQIALAIGDRLRVTAGGKTKDGKHRLINGSLFNVQGFTRCGDIMVDHGWVIDKEFGHITHGYVVTSHASQGVTVDKVYIGASSESLVATDQRTAYVAVSRGREQALIFTDDREALLKAMCRPDEPVSATELAESREQKPAVRKGLANSRPLARQRTASVPLYQITQPSKERGSNAERGLDHER